MQSEELDQLTELLAKLEPGYLPYPVFEQVARLVALPIIEIIPLRVGQDGKIEVLLLDRGPEDPLWPNMLHTPGTVVRATDVHDKNNQDWGAFQRIFHDELADTAVSAPHYVGSMFHQSKRGSEQAQLYWVEVTEEPQKGTFYDTNNLPETLITSQVTFIGLATKNFETVKGASEVSGS